MEHQLVCATYTHTKTYTHTHNWAGQQLEAPTRKEPGVEVEAAQLGQATQPLEPAVIHGCTAQRAAGGSLGRWTQVHSRHAAATVHPSSDRCHTSTTLNYRNPSYIKCCRHQPAPAPVNERLRHSSCSMPATAGITSLLALVSLQQMWSTG
jgi:hypothetical protein